MHEIILSFSLNSKKEIFSWFILSLVNISKTDNEGKMSVIDPTFLVQPVFQDNQTVDEEMFFVVEDLWLIKAVRVLESEHCYFTTLWNKE